MFVERSVLLVFDEPPPPRAPNGTTKNLGKMCEMTHLHSTRGVFNRGHLRTQKASKLLAAGGPHWASLHRSPGPRASPPQSPIHDRSQHFGLPALALGAEATEGLQVTVEPGPLRALLRHW